MTEPYLGNLLGARFQSPRSPDVEYVVDRRLGEGGTSLAFLGSRVTHDGTSPVVLKVTRPQLAERAEETAMLTARKEVESLARVGARVPPSPFVLRLYDAGTIPYSTPNGLVTLAWLALEYVHGGAEGTTLDARLAHTISTTGYAFDRVRAARLVEHLCEGLEEVHQAGVIHRDLTPANVLCCGVGDAEIFKLSDFGIARPSGLNLTFGSNVLGTPGFMPPEQLGAGQMGLQSDLFSLAAVIYQVLTGSSYFSARTPIEALHEGRSDKRSTVLEGRHVIPTLRGDEAVCRELDRVLAQATAADAQRRPASARVLASSIISLLVPAHSAGSGDVLARHTLVSSVAPDPRWTVRHAPGDDRVIHSAAWDSDGRCLAATSRGLELWDGAEWLPAPDDELPVPRGSRCVHRVGAGRWMVGGERALLAEVRSRGAARVIRGPDERWSFAVASGDPDDLAVFVMRASGQPLALATLVGGRWLRPLFLTDAAYVAALARLDDEHWLIAGRSHRQQGFAAVFAPLRWELLEVQVGETRAYVATSGQFERGHAIAAGAEGRVIDLEQGQVRQIDLPEAMDLSAAALDIVGRRWVGGAGALWVSAGEGGWTSAWGDSNWRAPVVSIHADVGLVVAMTVDGAVIENRTPASEIGAAMVRRGSDRPRRSLSGG